MRIHLILTINLWVYLRLHLRGPFPGTVRRVNPNSPPTGFTSGWCAPPAQLPRTLHPGLPPWVHPFGSATRFCPPQISTPPYCLPTPWSAHRRTTPLGPPPHQCLLPRSAPPMIHSQVHQTLGSSPPFGLPQSIPLGPSHLGSSTWGPFTWGQSPGL